QGVPDCLLFSIEPGLVGPGDGCLQTQRAMGQCPHANVSSTQIRPDLVLLAALMNAPIPGTRALPVSCPVVRAQLPYCTRNPALPGRRMLLGPAPPAPHPGGLAHRATTLCYSRPQYSAHPEPERSLMPQVPLRAASIRATGYPYYTRQK